MSSAISGKAVLIVGGSSGIGFATASAAIQAGANVTIASRSSDKLAAASQRLGQVETLVIDASDEAATAAAMSVAGTFDHVVVTSGSVAPTPVQGQSTAKARAGFAGKFWSSWHVAAHAKIAADGSLTLVSGVFAVKPQKGMVAASCVNAAVEALARALALELAPIRVNAISPGLIDTPMWARLGPERRALFFTGEVARLPTQYLGKADDVAALILTCMANPLLTGSVLMADAGRTLV